MQNLHGVPIVIGFTGTSKTTEVGESIDVGYFAKTTPRLPVMLVTNTSFVFVIALNYDMLVYVLGEEGTDCF